MVELPLQAHPRKPAIIFLTWALNGGGAERSLLEVFRSLNRHLFHPVLWRLDPRNMYEHYLSPTDTTEVIPPFPQDLAAYQRLEFHRQRLPLYLRQVYAQELVADALRLYDRLKQFRLQTPGPVILCASQHSMNVRAAVLHWLCGRSLPVIFTEHNEPYVKYLIGESVDRRHLAWKRIYKMYPKATRIVAVSQAIKQSLTRRFRVDPAKITVIPNAIDTQAIRAKLRQRPPSHPFYQGRGPVFICTARFHVLKNHQLLLRSFVLVRRKIPAKLILLGHGDQHDTIRRTIDEMALAPHVAMLDFLPDPFAYVAHARLLLLPSYCEGQPLCVLEALACGVPVVSTRWRGVEELIQHRRTGFICAMNDAAFAHGILATLKLGKKPDFRRHALHFADRYDTAHIAPRHTAFFSSLVPRLKFSP